MSATGFDPAADGLITFVNTFTVHGPAEQFEKHFAEIAQFMALQPGFVHYTLSRHVEQADRYVNVALWTDVQSWRDAIAQPGFQPHAKIIQSMCTSEGHLYANRQRFAVGDLVR